MDWKITKFIDRKIDEYKDSSVKRREKDLENMQK